MVKPVIVIIGTRPEGIKMMPVYFALKKKNIPVRLCSVSQHAHLLDEVLEVFGVTPDDKLNIMKENQDLFHITEATLSGLKSVYEREDPSLVLVQGDTTTVMSAALAAYYKKIPVGHVEAGLRTGDIYSPYPEEVNRQIITRIAQYHFAPTSHSMANLLSEGVDRKSVYCTGNTVVDSLHIIKKQIDEGVLAVDLELERAVAGAIVAGQKMVLCTAHRRESFSGGIKNIVQAIKEVAQSHPEYFFFYPLHPNPHVMSVVQELALSSLDNVYCTPALSYKNLVYLLGAVDIVATDSGGIQEEAVSLGKPTLVLREKTERMEAVWEGAATLVGTDQKRIVAELLALLQSDLKKAIPSSVYGDGHAAERVARVVQEQLYIDRVPTMLEVAKKQARLS